MRLKELKENKEFESMLSSWDTSDMALTAVAWAIEDAKRHNAEQIVKARKREETEEDLELALEELNSVEWYEETIGETLKGLRAHLENLSSGVLRKIIKQKLPQLK